MNHNVWKKMLRAGLFALLLAASAVATLMPDWATTLKAQSYYGSVDLSLYVQPSTSALSAGTNTDLLITLANAGPDDAYRARTFALIDGDAVASATSGCNEFPLGFPDCTLSMPLPAGGSADYLLTLSAPPLARGSVTMAVAAASDDAEIAPGQELVLLDLPIEAHVDLSSSAACDRPYAARGVPLVCHVLLRNTGPAAAANWPYFYVGTSLVPLKLNCNAPREELCPAQLQVPWSASVMMPGETIELSFQLVLDPSFSEETISIGTQAYSGAWDEIEDTYGDNSASLTIPVPLFHDGFDGN
jgi:hypothetical protein